MLNKDGKVADRFQIEKKRPVTPVRIAKPWKLNQAKPSVVVIPKHASWKYFAEGHPEKLWNKPNFDASGWKSGKAGFGYGDDDDTTVLPIKGKQSVVYIRRGFSLKNAEDLKKLWLSISYDDGFILYLNGREALRRCIKSGRGEAVEGVTPHEASGKFELIDLSLFAPLLHVGENTIAIEGHNCRSQSSDFTLHPTLLLKKQ
jgi:hypothetical protein